MERDALTHKIIPNYTLKINGFYDMTPGKTLPSYCRACRRQQLHRCTGEKQKGNETLYRFECTTCKEKLEGKK